MKERGSWQHKRARALKVLRPNVAGIDLGSRDQWVCRPQQDGDEKPNVRQFGTTTALLRLLAD